MASPSSFIWITGYWKTSIIRGICHVARLGGWNLFLNTMVKLFTSRGRITRSPTPYHASLLASSPNRLPRLSQRKVPPQFFTMFIPQALWLLSFAPLPLSLSVLQAHFRLPNSLVILDPPPFYQLPWMMLCVRATADDLVEI